MGTRIPWSAAVFVLKYSMASGSEPGSLMAGTQRGLHQHALFMDTRHDGLPAGGRLLGAAVKIGFQQGGLTMRFEDGQSLTWGFLREMKLHVLVQFLRGDNLKGKRGGGRKSQNRDEPILALP